MYKLVFEDDARKDFLRLPKPVQKVIREKLKLLAQNPSLLKNNIKTLKGKYKGLKRLRVGKYRVIFEERENELIILIIRIARRGEVY